MVCVEWREITLICPYFVPPTSPFQKRNEKRMIELQQRVLESKGNIIIMTDANGWIGELPSLVAKKEDGYEREGRTSEKQERNKRRVVTQVARREV